VKARRLRDESAQLPRAAGNPMRPILRASRGWPVRLRASPPPLAYQAIVQWIAASGNLLSDELFFQMKNIAYKITVKLHF
jgi:hypothetical protein